MGLGNFGGKKVFSEIFCGHGESEGFKEENWELKRVCTRVEFKKDLLNISGLGRIKMDEVLGF